MVFIMKFLKIIILLLILSCGNSFAQTYKNTYSKNLILNSNAEIDGSHSITLISPSSMTSSVTFSFPPTVGTAGQLLSTLGNGSLTFTTASAGAGSVAGNLDGEVQYKNGSDFGASSSFLWDNTNHFLGIGTSSPSYTLDVYGGIRLGGNGRDGELRMYSEQGATDYELIFQPHASMSQSVTYTWPADDGTNGQVLVTDGSGNLYWSSSAAGGSFDCTGQGTGGGENNTASGNDSFIGGGSSNTTGATDSFIGGGTGNSIESGSSQTAIVGGSGNSITGSSADESFIGGGQNNTISGGESAIVAGEGNAITGDESFIGAGKNNTINSDDAIIGAGENNTIGINADKGFIGAGKNNYIYESDEAGILAGNSNTIGANANNSAIGAGTRNLITDNDSFIGAGDTNTITAQFSVIGGGHLNTVTGQYGVIVGGSENAVTDDYSSVLGGESNTVGGVSSAVLGGQNNFVSGDYSMAFGQNSSATVNYSVAMGRRAKADHTGSFVFADGNDADINSQANNSYTARFTGGFYLFTDNGGTPETRIEDGDGAWQFPSDSSLKELFVYHKPEDIFEKLIQLPLSSWNYKGTRNKRNYGPMAQDFFRLFGHDDYGQIGTDTTISTHNLASVGILGLQGLHKKIEEQENEIEKLREENNYYNQKIDKLTKMINEIEKKYALVENKQKDKFLGKLEK
jgi:hypothetical protein